MISEVRDMTYWEYVWNEMNRVLGHICAHIDLTGLGEPPEDGEMTVTLQT